VTWSFCDLWQAETALLLVQSSADRRAHATAVRGPGHVGLINFSSLLSHVWSFECDAMKSFCNSRSAEATHWLLCFGSEARLDGEARASTRRISVFVSFGDDWI
jgi:hypothetical protein